MKRTTKNLTWKQRLAKPVGALVLFEVGALLASYAIYYKVNHDLEFRYKVYKSRYFSSIVEGYYKLGETLNPEVSIRQVDQEIWKRQGKDL